MLHGSFSGQRKNIGGLRKEMWIKEADNVPYYLWYIKKFSVEEFEALYQRAHQATKYSIKDLEEMYEMRVDYLKQIMES